MCDRVGTSIDSNCRFGPDTSTVDTAYFGEIFELCCMSKDSTLKLKTVKHRLPVLTHFNFCSSGTAGYGMLLNSQF